MSLFLLLLSYFISNNHKEKHVPHDATCHKNVKKTHEAFRKTLILLLQWEVNEKTRGTSQTGLFLGVWSRVRLKEILFDESIDFIDML